MDLQFKRNGEAMQKYRGDIEKAGLYLADGYLANCWPNMNVTWGTYQGHLGHRSPDYGGYSLANQNFGCFRCHDDEHQDNSGKTIPQNCDLCHDEPNF